MLSRCKGYVNGGTRKSPMEVVKPKGRDALFVQAFHKAAGYDEAASGYYPRPEKR
jgi:hypothetical protein